MNRIKSYSKIFLNPVLINLIDPFIFSSDNAFSYCKIIIGIVLERLLLRISDHTKARSQECLRSAHIPLFESRDKIYIII